MSWGMVGIIRFPDEEAGQIPMAFVARKPGSDLDEAGVIEFVAKQVRPCLRTNEYLLVLR